MTGHFTVGRIWDLTARAIISSPGARVPLVLRPCSPLSLCRSLSACWYLGGVHSLTSGYATLHREYLEIFNSCVGITL